MLCSRRGSEAVRERVRGGYNYLVVTTHTFRPLAQVALDDREGDRYCLGCGYNLRGLADGRCPECGRDFDVHEHGGLRAPWVDRRRLGTFVAFWATAALVTFRPVDFAGRFNWPRVRYHGSHVFRFWVLLHATAATTVAAAAVAWHYRATAVETAVVLGAIVPSAACFFYGATELWAFFTGPRLPTDRSEEMFRARLVNDYASAAVAWLFLPSVLVVLGAAAGRLTPLPTDRFLFLLAGALTAWIGVLWFGDVMALFGKALSLRNTTLVVAAVLFPVRCAGVAVLTAIFVFAPVACCVGGFISLRP